MGLAKIAKSHRWMVVCAVGVSLLMAASATAEDDIRYNRDIRPLLSDRCFLCHGPDASSREEDLRLDESEAATEYAIVPGSAEDSEVFLRISSDDPDERMPPADSLKEALTAGEIDLIRRWIEQGAKYEDHWSYITPQRPEVPQMEGDAWVRTDIDRFIALRLEAEGLKPSPDADKRILIRRLYFDLLGLPPTAEQVEAFVADTRPEAYEELVDALLESKHYGERMAIYWLDLVRFAIYEINDAWWKC